jgi:hypothetical protein
MDGKILPLAGKALPPLFWVNGGFVDDRDIGAAI